MLKKTLLETLSMYFWRIHGGFSEGILGKIHKDTSGGILRRTSCAISEGISTQKSVKNYISREIS